MTFRAPLLLAVLAATGLVACGDGAGTDVPAEVDLSGIAEDSLANRLAYLDAYRFGERLAEQDSTFDLDVFLQGLADGFAADSSEGVAYALGYERGFNLTLQNREDSTLTISLPVYVSALREGFRGDEIRIGAREERMIVDEVQMRQIRRDAANNPQAAAFLGRVEQGRVAADSFMTANASADSVQTTESGLQYIVREEGSGASPEDGDTVQILYRGYLSDGTLFDQNRPGAPAEFALGGGLIPGMEEAIMDMQIGGKRRIFIPPGLGYGLQGIPNSPIGPNSVLIFDVELVDILSDAEGTQAPALSDPQAEQPPAE